MKAGFSEEVVMWAIIFVVQYYSLTIIFLVARQNQQKIQKTLCTQFMYLLVFISQNIICILALVHGRDYFIQVPDPLWI